jgi:hypothetical protein
VELRTHGIALTLDFGQPGEDDWLACAVVVDVPGFHGQFDCQLMRCDLEQFRSELANAVTAVGQSVEVRLVSTDPGIDLRFMVNRLGQIKGRYELQNYDAPGSPALFGSFEMDQTFLEPLLVQVDGVLRD